MLKRFLRFWVINNLMVVKKSSLGLGRIGGLGLVTSGLATSLALTLILTLNETTKTF